MPDFTADLSAANATDQPATAVSGGAEAAGDFLKSPQGRALIRDVSRGVFSLLRKKR